MSLRTLHVLVVGVSVTSCVREPSLSDDDPADSTPTDSTPDSEPLDTGPTDTGAPDTSDTSDSPIDGDGDGYSKPEDCNDADPSMHPGAEDDCGDAVDEDCDGVPLDCESLPDIMLDAADTTIHPSHPGGEWDSVGNVVVSLGDLDADGNADFGTLWSAAGVPFPKGPHKEAWVFSGPIDSGRLMADDEAIAIVRQTDEWDEELSAMAGAGDVDADGYDDLVLGTWQDWGGVHVLLGPIGDTITVDDADASWTSEALNEGAGHAVDGGFDFDGDGHDDFVVGSPWALDSAGAAYWISGADLEFEHFSDADATLDGLSTDSKSRVGPSPGSATSMATVSTTSPPPRTPAPSSCTRAARCPESSTPWTPRTRDSNASPTTIRTGRRSRTAATSTRTATRIS